MAIDLLQGEDLRVERTAGVDESAVRDEPEATHAVSRVEGRHAQNHLVGARVGGHIDPSERRDGRFERNRPGRTLYTGPANTARQPGRVTRWL